MPSEREQLLNRELALLNRKLSTYPLRGRPTGRPEFNEYWALRERQLALLIERAYPNARAYIKARVKATRTAGRVKSYGRGYIREWDIVLEWVSGPLKGRFTPVEVKTAPHLLKSVEGGLTRPDVETRYRLKTPIGGQLKKDLIVLPRADLLEVEIEDAVTRKAVARTLATDRIDTTRVTTYGTVPDIPVDGAGARAMGSLDGIGNGVSFRSRPPPRVTAAVAADLETAAVTTELATRPVRLRTGVTGRVAAGVRGLVAGILLDAIVGLILGWIEAEMDRRTIEAKLEASQEALTEGMRRALNEQRPILSRFLRAGSIMDLWYVVQLGFTYYHGEGAPGGVGSLRDVYVSGETVPEAFNVPEAFRLADVAVAAAAPEPPKFSKPDVVSVGVPFRHWIPGPGDLTGFWDLEARFGYPRSVRFVDRFEIMAAGGVLTMRHVGVVNPDSRVPPTLPMPPDTGSRARRVRAHGVEVWSYDPLGQTLTFSVLWANEILERVYGAFIPTDYYFQLAGVGMFVGAILAPKAIASDRLFTFTQVRLTG